MIKTRESQKKAFNHLLTNVIQLDKDDILRKVLSTHGITTISQVLIMKSDSIDGLDYREQDGAALEHTPAHVIAVLHILKAWNAYLLQTLQLKIVDWEDESYVNPGDYMEFCLNIFNPDMDTGSVIQSPSKSPFNPSPSPSSNVKVRKADLAHEFRKGVKRDKSHYTVLKDEKHWDEWKRQTIATIYAHGCENIISSSYNPVTAEDILLFQEQQKYMFDVLTFILRTPMGKHFVRQHENTRDAQSVWRDYINHMRTSTKADIELEDLLTSLTSLRISPNFRGNTEGFLLDWLDKIRRYEELTPKSTWFPDPMKKAMLQNAVAHLAMFKRVKLADQLEIAKGRGPLPYQDYVTLLQSVAATYDHASSSSPNRGTRLLTNIHQITDGPSEYEYEDSDHVPNQNEVDDSYFGSFLQANRSDFRRRPNLPKEVWQKLTRADQLVWDQMSDFGKRGVIFGLRNSNSSMQHHPSSSSTIPNPSTPSTFTQPPPPRRRVQMIDQDGDQGIEIQYEDSRSLNPSQMLEVAKMNRDSIDKPSQQSTLSPADIRRVLSNSAPKPSNTSVNTHEYVVSRSSTSTRNALVDRGANGGLSGHDSRIIVTTDRKVSVSGIDNHELNDLSIVSCGAVVSTNRGEVIIVMHQYARIIDGPSIHSAIQFEDYGLIVDEKSKSLCRGRQLIQTPDGYLIPLSFTNGLAYMKMRPYTDKEWIELPHVILTSDTEWDPSVYDDDSNNLYDLDPPPTIDYDIEYSSQHPIMVSHVQTHSHTIVHELQIDSSASIVTPVPRNYELMRKYFLNVSLNVVKKTFESTTQYARSGWITQHIYDTHKAPFPALNVRRRNECVATDTIFADTPAIFSGVTAAQIFVGVSTGFVDVFPLANDGQFASTLMDVIRKSGAMDVLISDRAQMEISNKVKDILRHLIIDDWQSEAHYQHQNAAERRYKHIKRNVQNMLNISGATASCWLLCLEYVVYVMNRMATKSLSWRTPYESLTGITPDISVIYRFLFYDKIYFRNTNSRGDSHSFPSESNERLGRFVGFSTHVGHGMTYKILTSDTQQIIYRSRIRLASIQPNLRIDPPPSTTVSDTLPVIDSIPHQQPDMPPILESDRDRTTESFRPMAVIDPDDLIGRTYITSPADDGSQHRIKIVEKLDVLADEMNSMPEMQRFRATNDKETIEEIVTYNQILQRLEKDDGELGEWKFKSITSHDGPLNQSSTKYNGSKWNVRVEWENGEITWEPLGIIAKSDPITCAIYAKENGLLDTPGWIQFKKLARRQKKLIRMVNQAKLKSFRHSPIYKFGVQVPRNHAEAMELDKRDGGTFWADAESKELNQIDEYNTFTDLGKGARPDSHRKIKVHMVYDVKPDLRRKARLVAGGHLTPTPIHSVYSSVVSLRGLKISLFLAELNKLEAWVTDVGNAYLEAYTEEKLYIVAGPEFREREGHTLVITKALYGLKSSGLRWWEKLSEILNDLGFTASRAEDDIWMRDKQSHYEYIVRYVDDLLIVSSNPKAITDTLESKFKLKLKNTGPIKYHLGSDFDRDSDDRTLLMSPTKYITRMLDNYMRMFGTLPKEVITPLIKGDHPELDATSELDVDGVKKYQSLIGALQWVVTLGRLDIAVAVMTLSSFRAAPREGHLERAKRIYGYLRKMKHAAIRFRTGLPDYSSIPDEEYDWEKSIYGNMEESLPHDAPKAYGPPVIMTTYVDANLCHDFVTGRSVTGIIHLLNQTIVHYLSKKQPLVETATYGSEYMAARIATEQIMDLRNTLRYLGVNLVGPTYMFGDNKTVVDSSCKPKSKLHKRHVLLSYHRVREAIAAKVIKFVFIDGNLNPADILSKLWGYQQIKTRLKAMLFWKGDTADISE